MTRKLLWLVVAAVTVALIMPGAVSAKTLKIGVTQIVSHPALDADQKGFEKALKDAGLDAKYDYQNAQGDMSNAQAIARKFKAPLPSTSSMSVSGEPICIFKISRRSFS